LEAASYGKEKKNSSHKFEFGITHIFHFSHKNWISIQIPLVLINADFLPVGDRTSVSDMDTTGLDLDSVGSVDPSRMRIPGGSGSPDPYLWLMDPDPTPDPTPFFNDLKDVKKNIIFSYFFL
jgi:hypothetical protein